VRVHRYTMSKQSGPVHGVAVARTMELGCTGTLWANSQGGAARGWGTLVHYGQTVREGRHGGTGAPVHYEQTVRGGRHGGGVHRYTMGKQSGRGGTGVRVHRYTMGKQSRGGRHGGGVHRYTMSKQSGPAHGVAVARTMELGCTGTLWANSQGGECECAGVQRCGAL